MADHAETTHKHPNYFAVFIALAVFTALITAVEIMYQNGMLPVPRAVVNTAFITMSILKAVLVAMYYMHLKVDSFVYTALFGMPVLFAVIFFVLLLI